MTTACLVGTQDVQSKLLNVYSVKETLAKERHSYIALSASLQPLRLSNHPCLADEDQPVHARHGRWMLAQYACPQARWVTLV
jgi:hypothetical protein